MVQMNFNANDHEDAQDFGPIKPGWYTAAIDKSERCRTKSGNGSYIKLRFRISGPTCGNRVVFINLNDDNPNPDAVRIAGQQLASICKAVSVFQLQDTEQLHGKQMQINVVVKRQAGYEDSNDINGFKALEPGQSPQVSQQQQQAQPGAANPPWAQPQPDDDVPF
jgi:hypothetical protein